jgi:hypothetical protein
MWIVVASILGIVNFSRAIIYDDSDIFETVDRNKSFVLFAQYIKQSAGYYLGWEVEMPPKLQSYRITSAG